MLLSWLRHWAKANPRPAARSRVGGPRRPGGFTPRLEGLEDRRLLSAAPVYAPAPPPLAPATAALVAPQTGSPAAAALASAGATARPVNADNLWWGDYRAVTGPRPHDAQTDTVFQLHYTPRIASIHSSFYSGRWYTCLELVPSGLALNAVF